MKDKAWKTVKGTLETKIKSYLEKLMNELWEMVL